MTQSEYELAEVTFRKKKNVQNSQQIMTPTFASIKPNEGVSISLTEEEIIMFEIERIHQLYESQLEDLYLDTHISRRTHLMDLERIGLH